jgi:hypothetical protein
VEQAKQAAKAAVDDGTNLARGTSGGASAPVTKLLAGSYTPQSLANYGALCISAIPALDLGASLLPSDFTAVVGATLNGQPVPPAPVATPTPTVAPSATATPAAQAGVPVLPPATCGNALNIAPANGVPLTGVTSVQDIGGTAAAGSPGSSWKFQAIGLDRSSSYVLFVGSTPAMIGKTDPSGGVIDQFIVPMTPPGRTRVVVATSGKCVQHVFTVSSR